MLPAFLFAVTFFQRRTLSTISKIFLHAIENLPIVENSTRSAIPSSQ